MTDAEKQVKVAFVRRYKLAEHTCPVCGTVFDAPPSPRVLQFRLQAEGGLGAAWGQLNERRKAKHSETETREVRGMTMKRQSNQTNRYAIYARCSSDDQAHKDFSTIDVQTT